MKPISSTRAARTFDGAQPATLHVALLVLADLQRAQRRLRRVGLDAVQRPLDELVEPRDLVRHLGTIATAEEEALCYARHIGAARPAAEAAEAGVAAEAAAAAAVAAANRDNYSETPLKSQAIWLKLFKY